MRRYFVLAALATIGLGASTARELPTRMMPIPIDECEVDAGTLLSKKCNNVLPPGATSDDMDVLYKNLKKVVFTENATYVKRVGMDCTGQDYPMHSVWPAEAAVRMPKDKDDWRDETVIAMARIVPDAQHESCRDKFYGVGGMAPAGHAHSYYLVAIRDAKTEQNFGKNKNRKVGRWVLYRFVTKDGNFVSGAPIKDGLFIKCKKDHPHDKDDPKSLGNFDTCLLKTAKLALAHQYKMTYDSLQKLVAAVGSATITALSSVPSGLVDALNKLRPFGDPSTDPAWVTCSVGCCVADDETPEPSPIAMVKPSSPVDRAKAMTARN